MLRIRPAGSADMRPVYELICTLENRALPKEEFNEIFVSDLARPSVRYLVSEEHGSVSGFVSLAMEKQLHHAGLVGTVRELVVAERCRSRGVGASLLRAAERIAKEAGCSLVELRCGIRRARAHAFYERNGWISSHYGFSRRI